MEADKICLDDAKIRAKNNRYCQIIGDYLVSFSDPESARIAAVIVLIEGAKYSIEKVADTLKNELPITCDVEVCSQKEDCENYINVDSVDIYTSGGEFYQWIVSTLYVLSKG